MFIIVVCHLFLPAKSERFLVGSKWVFVLKSDTGRSEEIWSCIGYLDAPVDWEVCTEQPEGYEILSETGEKMMNKLHESLYGLK